MVSSGLNLTGNVSLNAESAIKAAQTLSQRFQNLAQNSRTASSTLRDQAAAMNNAASAASKERASLVGLAQAQAKINALQKESAANVALTQAKAGAVTSGAADKTKLADTRAQIQLDESEVKIINAQAVAEARVNTERERGAQIAGRTTNEAATAQGRIALANAKAQTEAVRQRIAAEQQEGRVQLNNARIAEAASRAQIAEAKLALQQQSVASAAGARIANQQRESLAITRGALGSLGQSFTRMGVLGGALFIGLAANAVVMDRQFANVIRTSDILDQGLTKVGENKAVASLRTQFDALAQTLPMSYKSLTEIGAAANQLGISSKNLSSFVGTVAKFSAVTGVSVDQASTAFGRLDSLIVNTGGRINGVNHDYQGLADAINKVGVNSVATDQQIINMSSQIAGVANAAGLGYKEIVGFSGALASVSISPYLARGMTTRLFTNIGNAVHDGGTELQKFANVAHLSAQQFSEDWKNDPKQALLALFQGIHQAGPDAVNVLKSLGVTSVLDLPALVRLANAADSTGKAGALLAQTFRDANDAIGENARQYAVISNTVQAKLQVALNRAQILLRNIGESNMGPLSAAIDTVSNAALSLSQNLDKPFKLFGLLPNLFGLTNGAAIGLGVNILGVVSVLALLGGAAAKVGSGLIALRQAYLGIGTFLGSSGRSFLGVGAAAKEAAAGEAVLVGENGRVISSNEALIASNVASARSFANMSSRSVGSKLPSGVGIAAISGMNPEIQRMYQGLDTVAVNTGKVTAATTMFAATGNRAFNAINAGVDRTLFKMQNLGNNTTVMGRTLNAAGSGGAAALTRIGSAASSLGSKIASVGRGIGNFLGGPLGLVLVATAGVSALNGIRDAYRAVGTSAGDASVVLSKANSSLDILNGTQIDQNSYFGTLLSGPKMGAFVTSTQQFSQGLKNLGGGGLLSDTIQQFATLGQEHTNFEDFTSGLDKIDAGLKNLADSGNMDAAIKGIQTLFKGQDDTAIANGLAHMSNATTILNEKLNLAGKTAGVDNKNLIALAKGNGVLDAAQKGSATSATALANAFTDNAKQVNDYIAAIKGVGDATVDLNKQFSAVPKGSKNPYADFVKGTEASFAQYTQDQENILRVSKDTGISLKDLGSLDPGILSGALKGGKKAEAELTKLFQLKDARVALDQAMGELGSDPKLLGAFTSLGTKTQDAIAKSLGEGSSIPDAFAAAGPKAIAAFNAAVKGTGIPPIDIHAKVDEKDLASSLNNLSSLQAKKLQLQILGNAGPAIKAGESAVEIISAMRAQIIADADTVIAQKKGESAATFISRLHAVLKVLGDTSNVTAKGDDAATQIGKMQAKILIDADPTRASQSAQNVKDEITKLRTTMIIQGDTIPAQKKGESAAEYISRLHSILVVDANTAAAKIKGLTAAQQISTLKALISITGEAAPAQQKGESAAKYIERLKAFLHVTADTSDAQKKAAAAAHTISGLKSQFAIHGNTAPAMKSGESVSAYITRLKTVLKIDADKTLAQGKADAVSHYAANKHPVFPINANATLAQAKADASSAYAASRKPVMRINGNNSEAFAKANAAKAHADALIGRITVSANAGAANAAINYAARDRTTYINLVQTGSISAQAGRNAAMFNANGGPISGPGTGTSDSILSYLSNGEYVIRASQAKKYRALLDQINYGIAGYATGGVVAGGSARYAGAAASFNSSLAATLSNVTSITELSPYDRHLLQTIANNIGVTIAPEYIAGANSNVNRTQGRRGNG